MKQNNYQAWHGQVAKGLIVVFDVRIDITYDIKKYSVHI